MPLERVSQGFKDVSMSFQTNPLNNDLIALKNASAISRSLRNIVLTVPGEKFFSPNFGSRISESLFENIDSITANIIKDEIKRSIINYEQRVRLLNVQAVANQETNSFDVIISYQIIGADVPPQSLQFVLQPTR